MSKSEFRPIIAQTGWGRIGWAGKGEAQRSWAPTPAFRLPGKAGRVPLLRVPGRTLFSRQFQAKEAGIDRNRVFPGTGTRGPCPSSVWRPAWQGFQGWLCPARAGAIGACHHLFLPLEYNWGGDFGLMGACHHLFGEPHHSAPRQAQDAINCVRPRLFVKFF